MDAVAFALADPIRREILRILRQGTATAGTLAELMGERFDVSRPAVSRHLRVLREAGLAEDEAQGRERVYRLRPEPLADLADLIAELQTPSEWDLRFAALDTEVHRQKRSGASPAEPTHAESQPKKESA